MREFGACSSDIVAIGLFACAETTPDAPIAVGSIRDDMKYFYWNEKFEIGIPAIDHQHRCLVDLINTLADTVSDGSGLLDARAVLDRLIQYAAEHFSDEEKFLAQSTLSDSEKTAHQKSHQAFIEEVLAIAKNETLEDAASLEKILEFLTLWLISHILRADMSLGENLHNAQKHTAQNLSVLSVSAVERVLIAALSETEKRFRLISDHAPTFIWICDPSGRRGFINKAMIDYIAVEKSSRQAQEWLQAIHPEDRAEYERLLEHTLRQPQSLDAEYRINKPDGSVGWVLERIVPRFDSSEKFLGLIASGTDITNIKQSEQFLAQANQELEREVARRTAQLEALMLTDPLTGIGNRRFICARLEEEIARAQRYGMDLTVVFIDVDYFKQVNDRYGHGVGDLVLQTVARCIKDGIRNNDLCARFGGEEFILSLVETDIQAACDVANRMRETIASSIQQKHGFTVTISAGLAQFRKGDSVESLTNRSDRALYDAKQQGRNRCVMEV